MLEACRVGRVTGDRYVNALFPHYCNAFANVIGTVAFNFGARTLAIRSFAHHFKFASVVVELSLNVSKSVDTRDDLSSVLSETIEDYAERLLAYLVGFSSNLDSSFGSSERLVTCQESEALGFLAEKASGKVSVTKTNLTVVGNRARDTERLETDTDSLGSVGSILAALLDSDGSTYHVSPLSVLEADGLSFLASEIRIDTGFLANFVSFLNVFDSVLIQSSDNLLDATILRLKFNFS